MLEPTAKQIAAAQGMGWVYIDDCLFVKGDWIGWFEESGFKKVFEHEF